MRIWTYTCLIAVGCGGDPAASSPQSPAPAIVGANRTIHWAADGSFTEVAGSPDHVFIEAELPGDDVRPATIDDDGRFAIDGAPPSGPYWLRIVDAVSREDVYVLTDATEIDLARDVVGRDDGLAASAETTIVVNAGGLDPWLDGDDGDFVIADLGHWSGLTTFYSSNGPVVGATTLAGLTYDWQEQPLPAVPQGAAATFVQLRVAHDDLLGLDYTSPLTSFQSDPIAIADSSTSRVSGTFGDPGALDVPVAWTRSAFFAQAAAMHPARCQDQLGFETYWVHAVPGHGAHGDLARSNDGSDVPDFGPTVVDGVFTEDTNDLTGTFHVSNPYPQDWLYAKYAVTFELDCPTPGGDSPGNAVAEIGVVTDQIGADAVVPLVGPVGAPRIDAGTVSWTAPAIGTPTSYQLHLLQVSPGALFGGLVLHETAEMIVAGDVTSITLPRDVLLPGELYTIEIRAVARGGQSITTAPFRAGMPLGYADLLTPYFQP